MPYEKPHHLHLPKLSASQDLLHPLHLGLLRSNLLQVCDGGRLTVQEEIPFEYPGLNPTGSLPMTTTHHQTHKPAAQHHTSPAGLDFIFRHEAQAGVSNHLHWPGGSSGVTLGPGYDMKERSKPEIVRHMMRIGVPKSTAEKVAGGSKLAGSAAEDFADDNENLVALSNAQETALLGVIVPIYEDIVRRNVHVHLKQNEFDALVSFVYNPGGSFLPVSQAINAARVAEAMQIIKTRITTGGARSAGLLHRRIDEVQLYLHGAYHRHHHVYHHQHSQKRP